MSTPAAPVSWWRFSLRWLLRLALVSLIGVGGSYLVYRSYRLHYATKVLATIEASDPDWRGERLLVGLPPIPDEQNSALLMQAIHEKLPERWPNRFNEASIDLFPAVLNERLNPPQMDFLRSTLQEPGLHEGRTRARDLLHYPRGRFLQPESDSVFEFFPKSMLISLACADILAWDALLLANENRSDDALQRVLAIWRASRALEDIPSLMPQTGRLGMIRRGTLSVQRTLALGQATDANLRTLDDELQKLESFSALRQVARGERWRVHRTIERLLAGDWDREMVPKSLREPFGSLSIAITREQILLERGIILQTMHDLCLAAEDPERHKDNRIFRIQGKGRYDSGHVGHMLISDVRGYDSSEKEVRAELVLLRVALAVERYRLRHGRWPETLKQTVPAFLDSVPSVGANNDLITYRLRPGGILLTVSNPRYPKQPAWSTDKYELQFRLWHVDRRAVAEGDPDDHAEPPRDPNAPPPPFPHAPPVPEDKP